MRLDGSSLTLWWRPSPREEPRPATTLHVLPKTVNLGAVVIGERPSRRNLLVLNHGSLPLVLESAVLAQTTEELRIVEPLAWPRVLAPGDSDLVTFEFAPRPPPGVRDNTVRIRYDRDEVVEVPLRGFADPPPRPVARLEPELLSFGVVAAGHTRTRDARLSNDGSAELHVGTVAVDAGTTANRLFTVAAAPATVSPGGVVPVAVTYAPRAGVVNAHQATLRVATDDPHRPVAEIDLFGQVAAAALVVDPLHIAFNPSPLVDDLPPGLGSARSVNVYNTGAAALTITDDSLRIVDTGGGVSPHFVLSDGAGFPPPPIQPTARTIPAGGSLALTVVFRPVTAGDHVARLVLTPTDATLPTVDVGITGTGVA